MAAVDILVFCESSSTRLYNDCSEMMVFNLQIKLGFAR
jgi:hypothetical protein